MMHKIYGHGFFLKPISQNTEPILGMFVLILMHFSWGFQIYSWNSRNGIDYNVWPVDCSCKCPKRCMHDSAVI